MPPRPPPRARGHFGYERCVPQVRTLVETSSLALGARTILTSTTGVHYRFRIRARTFATAKGLRVMRSPFVYVVPYSLAHGFTLEEGQVWS